MKQIIELIIAVILIVGCSTYRMMQYRVTKNYTPEDSKL